MHHKFVLKFLAALFICTFIASQVSATTYMVNTDLWITTPNQEVAYIIGQYNSTHYFAKNATGYGTSANLGYEFLSTNASYIFSSVLAKLSSGGSIFVKAGRYTLPNTVSFATVTYHSLTITGEGYALVNITSTASTILQSSNSAWAANYGLLTISHIRFYIKNATPKCGLNLTYTEAVLNDVGVSNSGTQNSQCVGIFYGKPNLTAGNGADNSGDYTWDNVRANYFGINYLFSIDHLVATDVVSSAAIAIHFEFRGGLHNIFTNPQIYIGTGSNASSYGYYFYGTGMQYEFFNVLYENHTVMTTPQFYIANFVTYKPIIHSCNPLAYSKVTLSNLPEDIDWGTQWQAYSFIVWIDGTYYCAQKSDGSRLIRSTNASYVINSAINALTAGRTWTEKVYLSAGSYTLDSHIVLTNHTWIEGAGMGEMYHNSPQITVEAGHTLDYVFTATTGTLSDITITSFNIDCNKANAANAGGIQLSGNQWGDCVIRDIRISGAKGKGVYIHNMVATVSNVILSDIDNRGFDFNAVTDSYLDHLTTSSVDLEGLDFGGSTSTITNCYFGGSVNSTSAAAVYVWGTGKNFFSNIRVDYTSKHAFYLASTGNNTITGLFVSDAKAASQSALYLYHSNFTIVSDFHTMLGGGTSVWNYAIYESTCKYNSYTACIAQDITNSNSTSSTSRIFGSLFGTTWIDDHR